jgi:uncharacterized protein YoxC
MSAIKPGLITSLVIMAGLLGAHTSGAFGLKTHGWIANDLLQEIRNTCKVRIAGKNYRIAAEQCDAIKAHPGDFLSGAMGPDIYPDLMTGQVTTHPGVTGGWQTGDWLKHVVDSAGDQRSLAFAMGYLLHAAGDMFAHSYVNTFAGDVFDLKDERAVEARHVAIEKYLDAHVPANAADPGSLSVPAERVRDTLLYNDAVVSQYRRSGSAPHIVAMFAVRDAVGDLTDALEGIEDVSTEIIARYVAAHVNMQGKLATGEAQLEVTREALRIAEQEAALRRKVHDEAKRAFDKAAGELEENERLWADANLQYEVQTKLIDASQKAFNDATRTLNDLNRTLNDLNNKIASVPTHVTEQVCKAAAKILGKVAKAVCNEVQKVNSAWSDLNNSIAKVKNRIGDEARKQADATAALTAATANRAAAIQRKVTAESRRGALEATKVAAEISYRSTVEPLRAQEQVAAKSRAELERLEQEVEQLRKQLVDHDKLLAEIRALLDDLNYLSFLGRNWSKGIERAGEEYIQVGFRVSQHILKGEKGSLEEYVQWLSCHGDVFLAVPYQYGEGLCKAKTVYQDTMQRIEKMQRALLLPGVREVYEEIDGLKEQLIVELKDAVKEASFRLLELVADDRSLAQLIRMLEDPSYATRNEVQGLLATVGDSGGKQLLTFRNGADLIDGDAYMEAHWEAEKFAPVAYARTMSRLALLPGEELNAMAGDVAGFWFSDWKLHPEKIPRYSLLFRTLRSIDGNHQWQPYGLPYARSTGGPVPGPESRRYGYGPMDGSNFGLAMYLDPEARRKVFLRLFPRQLSMVENDPRLQAGYPFPSCEANPFPMTFIQASGQPATSDDTCKPGAAAAAAP